MEWQVYINHIPGQSSCLGGVGKNKANSILCLCVYVCMLCDAHMHTFCFVLVFFVIGFLFVWFFFYFLGENKHILGE